MKELMTIKHVMEHDLLPFCSETIKRMIRKGELHAVKVGNTWYIHKDELEAYTSRFKSDHNAPVAGLRVEKSTCREKPKKGYTNEVTHRTGGQATQTRAAKELGALLGMR